VVFSSRASRPLVTRLPFAHQRGVVPTGGAVQYAVAQGAVCEGLCTYSVLLVVSGHVYRSKVGVSELPAMCRVGLSHPP